MSLYHRLHCESIFSIYRHSSTLEHHLSPESRVSDRVDTSTYPCQDSLSRSDRSFGKNLVHESSVPRYEFGSVAEKVRSYKIPTLAKEHSNRHHNCILSHKIERTILINSKEQSIIIMMFKSLQIIIAFCILFVSSVQAGLLCPLCGSVNKVPTRWDHVVSHSPFKTCRSVYFEMAMRPLNHPTCAPMQRQYQATCCNAAPAPAPAPAPVPATSSSSGGNPYCRICRNDDYPGFPNVMVSARYVGTFSCGSLYHRGKNGQVSFCFVHSSLCLLTPE